ncbi:uncharacterized protein FTOL_04098 [Fusarium torulosum]|uniref:N-acetyltransferase domain-containing protein n=1 Tax=Fusarium torulosum TaxID=33205 RepID=A0AAE8M581_9HYPO|nr:uncharacterized protein FTOL_04098 [Fusarium torulosum]
MSWDPSSPNDRARDRTPSPNVFKSLEVFRGMRASLGKIDPPQQLFPSDIVKDRLRESSQQQPTEIVQSVSQHASVKAGSGTADYEQSSVGTWNSPRERELSSASTDVQGAPLPAPLHIIQAIGSTSVIHRQPSFSNASLALSGCPVSSDKQDFQQVDEENTQGPDEDMTEEDADTNSLEIATAVVEHWETDKENYPVVNLAQARDPSTDDCDIDTSTGKFVPPIRYIKLQRDGKEEHNRHRMDCTSEDAIRREIARRQLLKEEIQRMEQEAQYANQKIEEDTWPNAECTLRPVASGDFQGIADIMNLEMKQGKYSQLFIPSVGPAHIASLYNTCQAKHRPFIVAVPSPKQIINRTGWSKAEEEEYQEFLKFKQARNASQDHDILGFAFVGDSRQGFLGGTCPGSRFNGQIKLVVHPSHRRKLIGSALLDRVLLCVAIYHRSLVDYTWDCSDARKTYEYVSAHNKQKYNKLYIEIFFTGKEDPRIKGISRFLEKFDFERVAYFKDAVKHGSQPGVWKDMVVWELEARMTSEIIED